MTGSGGVFLFFSDFFFGVHFLYDRNMIGEMIDAQFDEKPVHGLKNLIRRWISQRRFVDSGFSEKNL